MSKIRRNDSCPCGSGKKYKRCCGRNTVNQANLNAVNNELYRVYQELISYTTTKYQNKIEEQHQVYDRPSISDEETKEIYHTGLTPWIVSSVPCFNNNETIIRRLYRATQKKLSLHAKELFIKWLHTKPSIYEVISIQSPSEQFMTIKELRTDDTFYIPIQNADDFMEGSLLIGIIIPFIQHHNFLLTMVKLYDRDKHYYAELLSKFDAIEGGLDVNFPKFLVEALDSESIETKWNNPTHEEVVHLLTKHLSLKEVNDRVITESITNWNTFCKKEDPTIKRIEPYAAALEYYIQKVTLNNANVRQVDIAEEYGTSPSTLSNIYRRITQALSN